MNTLDLALKKVRMKKAASTNGGEWQGPCPGCGDGGRPKESNRFHVWPVQNEGKGAYWCRSCGKTGDNIQFLRDFEGMSFRAACAALNIALPDQLQEGRPSPPPQRTKPEFHPATHIPPADLWQEKAEQFLSWTQTGLQENAEQLSWLAARGIDGETARNYRLGWNAGEKGKDIYRPRKSWGLEDILKDDGKPKKLWIPRGLVIPYIIEGVVRRVRIRRPEGEPRYYVLPGSSMATMIIERDRRAFVVVESELDAIAVAAASPLAGAVSLGTLSAKPDADANAVLASALQIMNALDYGDIGGGAKAAEKAIAWWKEHFERCDRWPVPQGKDPGEAYRLGTDLKKWIKVGITEFCPALTISEGGHDAEARRAGTCTGSPQGSVRVPGNVTSPPPDLPPSVLELLNLLKNNPGITIVNTTDRYTVLRHGKFVGGRINDLVFRDPAVLDYIAHHPAEEIDGRNFIVPGE